MGDFFQRCKYSIHRAMDRSFVNNIANIVLLLVALLLLIALMLRPSVLVGLALFCLFLSAILYC